MARKLTHDQISAALMAVAMAKAIYPDLVALEKRNTSIFATVEQHNDHSRDLWAMYNIHDELVAPSPFNFLDSDEVLELIGL